MHFQVGLEWIRRRTFCGDPLRGFRSQSRRLVGRDTNNDRSRGDDPVIGSQNSRAKFVEVFIQARGRSWAFSFWPHAGACGGLLRGHGDIIRPHRPVHKQREAKFTQFMTGNSQTIRFN